MAEVRAMVGEVPLTAKPDYVAYVDYLESRGWSREQLTLDENNAQLCTRTALLMGLTGVVIDVRCPAGQKMSFMGVQQVPKGADARTAHALRIRLAGTADAEIGLYTKIRITKEKTSEAIVQLARAYYGDVNLVKQSFLAASNADQLKTDPEWYRWKQGVELNGEERLRITCIAPNINILQANITFAMDLDLWTREE